jgi:hypothetical protein
MSAIFRTPRSLLPLRVIRRAALHVWLDRRITEWEQEGRFPQHVQLGGGSIGWIETELDAWGANIGAACECVRKVGADAPTVHEDDAPA